MYCGCHGPNFGPEPHSPVPPHGHPPFGYYGGPHPCIDFEKVLPIHAPWALAKDLVTIETEIRTKVDAEVERAMRTEREIRSEIVEGVITEAVAKAIDGTIDRTIEEKLSGYADKESVTTELAKKADKTSVTTELAKKADKTSVASALEDKADSIASLTEDSTLGDIFKKLGIGE